MGIRNYWIAGVSGAGKTSVAEELERRGYHVVHGDRQFAYYGDPETGKPLDLPTNESEPDTVQWGYEHWIWPLEKVHLLTADQSHPVSFFCGGAKNYPRFVASFDKVFVLDVDLITLRGRLAARPDDEFGGKPVEREVVERAHASKSDHPKGGILIDATAPLGRVVDEILSKCRT